MIPGVSPPWRPPVAVARETLRYKQLLMQSAAVLLVELWQFPNPGNPASLVTLIPIALVVAASSPALLSLLRTQKAIRHIYERVALWLCISAQNTREGAMTSLRRHRLQNQHLHHLHPRLAQPLRLGRAFTTGRACVRISMISGGSAANL